MPSIYEQLSSTCSKRALLLQTVQLMGLGLSPDKVLTGSSSLGGD